MQPTPKKGLSPWLIMLGGAVLIALVVTSTYFISRPKTHYAHAALTLPEGIEQPVWMPTAPPSLKELYAFAAQHREELQYIPCYCGCAPGHKDNFECYWKHNGDGIPTAYEEHSYG